MLLFSWIQSFFYSRPAQTEQQTQIQSLLAENRDLRAKLQAESVSNAVIAVKLQTQESQTPEARAIESFNAQAKALESVLNQFGDMLNENEDSRNHWKELYDLLMEKPLETLDLRRAMLQHSLEYKLSLGMLGLNAANFLALKYEQIRRDCFKVEGPGFDASLLITAQQNVLAAAMATVQQHTYRMNVCAVVEDIEHVEDVMRPGVLVLLYERLGLEVPANLLRAVSSQQENVHVNESEPDAAPAPAAPNAQPQPTELEDQAEETESVDSQQIHTRSRPRSVSA